MNGYTENFSIWTKTGCMRCHKKHPEWKLSKSRLHNFGESSSLQKSAAFYNLLVILYAPSASKCLHDFIWEIGSVLQVDIFGTWQVLWKAVAVMEELKETFFWWWWGGKVMCITRGRPIGLHYPIALHRLHSAPAAEAYLAPFIMHGHPPIHAQACHGSFLLTTQPNSTSSPKRMWAVA